MTGRPHCPTSGASNNVQMFRGEGSTDLEYFLPTKFSYKQQWQGGTLGQSKHVDAFTYLFFLALILLRLQTGEALRMKIL